MKLLSVKLARSVWLFPLIDYNPIGKSLFNAIPLLVELYNFRKAPLPTEANKLSEGLKFEDGEFTNNNGDFLALDLTIHDDGIVVDTRSSTAHSDEFLDKMLSLLSDKYNLPKYEQILRKKIYVSHLFVTTDKNIDFIDNKMNKIYKYLSSSTGIEFSFGGLHIFPDQTEKVSPPPFTFERAIGVPFSEKRFFSSSGLQTDQHLHVLNELESIF